MKSIDGRPVIESTDYPEVVDKALRQSVRYWRQYDPDRAMWWHHTAQNSWETLDDDHGLRIEDPQIRAEYARHRNSILYMSPDNLELALVAYGCEILDGQIESPANEIN